MVTGDQVAIAKEMARQLGLGQNIVSANAFAESRYQEASQLTKTVEQADGFAQVFPEHKFHIVDILQKAKHIVGKPYCSLVLRRSMLKMKPSMPSPNKKTASSPPSQ